MDCLEKLRDARFAPISMRGTAVPSEERIGVTGICLFALEGWPGVGFGGFIFWRRSWRRSWRR